MVQMMRENRASLLADPVEAEATTAAAAAAAAEAEAAGPAGGLLGSIVTSRDELVDAIAAQGDEDMLRLAANEASTTRPSLEDLERGLPDDELDPNYGVLTRTPETNNARDAKRRRNAAKKAEELSEIEKNIVEGNLLHKKYRPDTEGKQKYSKTKEIERLMHSGAVDGFDFVNQIDTEDIINAAQQVRDQEGAAEGELPTLSEADGFGDAGFGDADLVAEDQASTDAADAAAAADADADAASPPPRAARRNRTAAGALDAKGEAIPWINGAVRLEDLPTFSAEDDAGRLKAKLLVSATELGVNVEDFVYHGGNILKLRTLHPLHEVPQSYTTAMRGLDLGSCALVGNSGVMTQNIWANAIDSHGTVVRLNQGPVRHYSSHVGSKTHVRFLNTRWAHKYTLPDGAGVAMWDLPLEENEVLLLARTSIAEANEVVDALKGHDGFHSRWYPPRGDVRILVLNSKVVSAIRTVLVNYRRRLVSRGFKPGSKSTTPSTGLLAAWALSQMCNHVTLYGFGLNKFGINRLANGAKVPYHYFSKGERAADDRMNPTHSFDLEYALLRALHREGVLYMCDVASGLTCGSRRDRLRWRRGIVAREACGRECVQALREEQREIDGRRARRNATRADAPRAEVEHMRRLLRAAAMPHPRRGSPSRRDGR